jgi:hypothetical protein
MLLFAVDGRERVSLCVSDLQDLTLRRQCARSAVLRICLMPPNASSVDTRSPKVLVISFPVLALLALLRFLALLRLPVFRVPPHLPALLALRVCRPRRVPPESRVCRPRRVPPESRQKCRRCQNLLVSSRLVLSPSDTRLMRLLELFGS